jgi:ABC-type transporter Mla subunit MlaD
LSRQVRETTEQEVSRVTTAQEQFNGAFKEGQDMLNQAVKAWQDVVSNAASTMAQNVQKFGESLQSVTAKPQVSTAVVDNVFDFAEQLLGIQRRYVKTMLESGVPAVEAANRSASAATEAFQSAAKDSASAVQSAADHAAENTTSAAKAKA